MSATGRGGIRLDDDAYETPSWCFQQFLPFLKEISLNPQTILEPGAGTGNLVRELRKAYPKAQMVAVEKRPECHPFLVESMGNSEGTEVRLENYLENDVLAGREFDLIFGNPPFGGKRGTLTAGAWLRFIQKSLTLLSKNGMLIFLLRLAVLEGQERNGWMRMFTPDVYVLPKRPSFTGKGSDSTAYAWMVWRKWILRRAEGYVVILPNPK